MIGPLPPATATRLEKVAVDNGFDREIACAPGWLGFTSSHAPLCLWLSAMGDELFIAAFSQGHVAHALEEQGIKMTNPLPEGAVAARSVTNIPDLHQMVRRAFQLSRSLPDEPLQSFKKQTASLPQNTEAERLVVQRVGQNIFRDRLMDFWDGRCAITGLAIPELLRAGHIKPWADCETDAERLDVFNGILLSPHLDAAFDRGLITIDDDGAVVISSSLSDQDRAILGLYETLRVRPGLVDGHRNYLPWHRDKVFRP